eukprot:scaffold13869_cov42-Phaeocystis_antarctica.AAC.1
MLHLYCRPFADAPPGDTRPADALTQLFEEQTKARPRHATPHHTTPRLSTFRHAGSARHVRQGRGAAREQRLSERAVRAAPAPDPAATAAPTAARRRELRLC